MVEALAGLAPFQVAFVVPDLERAVRDFDAALAAGPWRGYDFGSDWVADSTYRGEPAEWAARLVLNDSQPQFELIQPVSGPSIHGDWLTEHGEGLHHLGYVVESVAVVSEQMAAAGFEEVQTGHSFGAEGDGRFAYYDTTATLGFFLEAVEPPGAMPEPTFRL